MFGKDDAWVKARIDYVTDRVAHPGFRTGQPEPVEGLFLCMTPRSGSTFFGAVLRDNGFGEFMERFRVVKGSLERDIANARAQTYEDYVSSKISRDRKGGSVAFKLDWAQFVPLYYLGAWPRYFVKSHFIYLTRENMLLQAISRYVGDATGIFHSPHLAEGKSLPADVAFDFDKITEHLRYLINMMSAWEMFFAAEGVTPIRLTYEQIVEELPLALGAVAKATGRELPQPLMLSNEFKPISTDINQRLKNAFIEEYRRRERYHGGAFYDKTGADTR